MAKILIITGQEINHSLRNVPNLYPDQEWIEFLIPVFTARSKAQENLSRFFPIRWGMRDLVIS
jgi:hypothetical protein